MRHYALLIVLLALLLSACQSTHNAAHLVPDDSPLAFRVGAARVTVADYQQQLEQQIGPVLASLLAQGQTRDEITQLVDAEDVRQSIFDEMVQEELLLLVARQQGLGVDPQAIEQEVELRQPPPVDPTQPMALRDLTDLRVSVAREQLVFAVIARQTRADMFHARHILVADAATAEQVLVDLEAGADFDQLARELSQDNFSAARGGDLGWTTQGVFVPEFEEAAFEADLNEVRIVESQFGYHVLEVLERQEQRPFDDFEQLRTNPNAQQFYETTFLPWYAQLRTQAEASGQLEISADFDPNNVQLPFPEEE